MPRRPCSGRGASGSVVSHFGPPTAASSTASDCLQASIVACGSGSPGGAVRAPPARRFAGRVDRGASDQLLVVGEVAELVEHAYCGVGDLRADAVAWQQTDLHAVA